MLCHESSASAGVFPARHPSPTPYNFNHVNPFTSYAAQGHQYPQDYSQFQVGVTDATGFQQASWHAPGSVYGNPRPMDEWGNYGMPTTSGTISPHHQNAATYSYRGMGLNPMGVDYTQTPQHPHQGAQSLTVLERSPQLDQSPTSTSSGSSSSGSPTNKQLRPPYDWMKKSSYQSAPAAGTNHGKTRTKDKYRVVYSDHQRLELEKEFHYSRYITIRRKAELASTLSLSERQVKIWFQNRRAKERKQNKKRDDGMGGTSMGSDMQGTSDPPPLIQAQQLAQMHNQGQSQSPMQGHGQIPLQYPIKHENQMQLPGHSQSQDHIQVPPLAQPHAQYQPQSQLQGSIPTQDQGPIQTQTQALSRAGSPEYAHAQLQHPVQTHTPLTPVVPVASPKTELPDVTQSS
uniref:Homeobox parahox cdx n=1 Tax=Nucula tumidula TaxID=437803 RepID=A0A1J0M5Q2_9BIVA|nr:homeobox parahox cdx [Nucula tumidula]